MLAAQLDSAETQDAADALHRALACVMTTAPAWVIEDVDWEYSDEDWVRDAFVSLNRYGRWRITGEIDFLHIAPDDYFDRGKGAGAVFDDIVAEMAWVIQRRRP